MQIELKSIQDVEQLLVKLLKKSCEDVNAEVTKITVPRNDLENFDSLTALEVLTEFEEESGIHLEEDIFYVDVKPKEWRSVSAIAWAIWIELQKGGSNGSGS